METMPIIIDDFRQREDGWYQAKLGKPSGSGFKYILSPTGIPSKQKTKYMYKKVYERLTGKFIEEYISYAMRQGTELEPKGRLQYELINDVDVQEVALIYYDDSRQWVVSPDGLINKDGMLELKYAEPEIQIDRLLNGWDKKEHYPQLMGNLFTSGRQWIDRVSYHPGLDPVIDRYYRDDSYCAKLKIELESFCEELDDLEKKLRALN